MKLLLVGDVMPGRLVNAVLQHVPPSFPWCDTLPGILGADWRACNLECVISDRRPAVLPAKAFHFRSDARNVAVLQAAHIDAVSIANNHVLDFGPEAVLDMLDILDQAGDVVFGHSCHVFRGIDIYRERPIIYCTGDFIDDYAVDPVERNDQSFLYTIDVEERRPRRISLEPTMIDGFRARLARSDEAGAILDKMSSICTLVRRP